MCWAYVARHAYLLSDPTGDLVDFFFSVFSFVEQKTVQRNWKTTEFWNGTKEKNVKLENAEK